MSFLPGMFPAAAFTGSSPSVSYVGLTTPAAAQNFTLNTVAIGAADPTRRVIVGVQWNNAAAHRTISSITMDGVSMGSALVSVVGSGFIGGDIAFYSALKPAGTTADFQINFSGTNVNLGVAIFRAIGESTTTPHATMSDNTLTGAVLSGTINIPNSGWVVALGNGGGVTYTGMSWSGVTEQYESGNFGGALQSLLPVESNRAVSVTVAAASGFQGALAAISWG